VKNAFSGFLVCFLLASCGNDEAVRREDEKTVPPKFSFNYNLHSSLPEKWKTEFRLIMTHLEETIQVEPKDYFASLDIYAWKNTAAKPYKIQIGDASGASISGNENERYMVLEIPDLEFKYQSMHRYSVIPHEYFHAYQMSLSRNFHEGNIELKWLSEGGAATIESLYIQQYYSFNYFGEAQNKVNISAVENPIIFEKYDDSYNQDPNYSSSVFMALALSKELQKLNISEENSFKMIFKDFWLKNPNEGNWKVKFKETFTISIENFYNILSTYPNDITSVLPSEDILLENIFSK
jgi:hypothetical protein